MVFEKDYYRPDPLTYPIRYYALFVGGAIALIALLLVLWRYEFAWETSIPFWAYFEKRALELLLVYCGVITLLAVVLLMMYVMVTGSIPVMVGAAPSTKMRQSLIYLGYYVAWSYYAMVVCMMIFLAITRVI